MAKRKYKRKNWYTSIFGTRFDVWDLIIIGALLYYIYGVYQGINTPTWRVFELFAGVLFFVFILKQFKEFIFKKAKK